MWARSSILLAVLALAACDRPANSDGPPKLTFAPSLTGVTTAQIDPTVLPLIPVSSFICPTSLPPLSTSLNLIIGAASTSLAFNQLTLQPFDGAGVAGLPIVFTPIQLAGLFGTLIVPSGTTRTFTVNPQFGCEQATPASLIATFVLKDETGASQQMKLTARFAH